MKQREAGFDAVVSSGRLSHIRDVILAYTATGPTLFLLPLMWSLAFSVAPLQSLAADPIYKYTDSGGTVYFLVNWDLIPQKYRS